MDTTHTLTAQVEPGVSFVRVTAHEGFTHDRENNQTHNLAYSNHDRIEKPQVVTL